MSPLAHLQHHQSGLAGISQLRLLDDSLGEPAALEDFCAQLTELHRRLTGAPMQLLAVGENDKIEGIARASSAIWQRTADNAASEPFTLPAIREQRGEMWITNTQVNFCAKAYPTVPVQHPDAAALTVLGGVLRNGFLHRAIREQGGAYGGGASQDSSIAAFRFYSYRDPRLAETLQDFDAALNWMLNTQHEYQALEEAILGVVGSMDRPSSPAGEAKQHFHNRLFGRSHEQREHFRQNILSVSLDDLQRVTATYLKPELASTAVITNASQLDATASLRNDLNLSVQEL